MQQANRRLCKDGYKGKCKLKRDKLAKSLDFVCSIKKALLIEKKNFFLLNLSLKKSLVTVMKDSHICISNTAACEASSWARMAPCSNTQYSKGCVFSMDPEQGLHTESPMPQLRAPVLRLFIIPGWIGLFLFLMKLFKSF